MEPVEGRSPVPRRGDPNVKQMQLSLSTEEWRQLRAWAAEEATGVQEIVERVLRRELDGRPRLSL